MSLCAVAVLLVWPYAVQPESAAADAITREELIQAMAASIRITLPEAEGLGGDIGGVREDLIAYAQSLNCIPDSIGGLQPVAKQDILKTELTLTSVDPEYCRAQAKAYLMGLAARAKLSKLLPVLSPNVQQTFATRIQSLMDQIAASTDRCLGTLFSREEIDAYFGIVSAGFVTRMRSPASASFKRLPSEQEWRSLALEFDQAS